MSLLDVTKQRLDWVALDRDPEWHLILSQRALSDHTFVYANLFCAKRKVSTEDKLTFANTVGTDYLGQLPPRSVFAGPISLTKVTRVCRTCVEGAKRATGTFR